MLLGLFTVYIGMVKMSFNDEEFEHFDECCKKYFSSLSEEEKFEVLDGCMAVLLDLAEDTGVTINESFDLLITTFKEPIKSRVIAFQKYFRTVPKLFRNDRQ